ncbi:MAG TPA: hypothetical protein VEA80_09890 [Vitreimonas sp.]|uniref:hypothetical protein n=1 Tax=Vitreimonas sp. TaxID=3069702 RepID=UPI002D4A2CD3|nr:hypothetical protein [Vitreimonas sp.]HYD87776.1 hypothetical protein [Vitreimonas sp.]
MPQYQDRNERGRFDDRRGAWGRGQQRSRFMRDEDDRGYYGRDQGGYMSEDDRRYSGGGRRHDYEERSHFMTAEDDERGYYGRGYGGASGRASDDRGRFFGDDDRLYGARTRGGHHEEGHDGGRWQSRTGRAGMSGREQGWGGDRASREEYRDRGYGRGWFSGREGEPEHRRGGWQTRSSGWESDDDRARDRTMRGRYRDDDEGYRRGWHGERQGRFETLRRGWDDRR